MSEADDLPKREDLDGWDKQAQEGKQTTWKYRFRIAMCKLRELEDIREDEGADRRFENF